MALESSDLKSGGVILPSQSRKVYADTFSQIYNKTGDFNRATSIAKTTMEASIKSGIGNPQRNTEEAARQLANLGLLYAAALVTLYGETQDPSLVGEILDAIGQRADVFKPMATETPGSNLVLTGSIDYAIKGMDTEERVTIGVVYMPDEADLQNEWAEKAKIESAAHNWMEEYRWADTEHSWQEGAGTPVESYIAPCDIHSYFGKDLGSDFITEGSWVVGMKWAEAPWEEVKKGNIRGFSLGGFKSLKAQDPPARGKRG